MSPCRWKSWGWPRRKRASACKRTIALVNLAGFEKKFPWQLSGGMQQRASIARALSFEADMLLMDEPFGALDEIVRDHLNEQLLELWAQDQKDRGVSSPTRFPKPCILSTKIVVMSPRPGRIHGHHRMRRCRSERPLEIRETPEIPGDRPARVRDGLCGRGTAYDD